MSHELFISATDLRRDLTEVLESLPDLESPLAIVHHSKIIGVIWGDKQFRDLVESVEGLEKQLYGNLNFMNPDEEI